MRFKTLIPSVIVILALILLPSCDSVNKALELRQRYKALQKNYAALQEQHVKLKTKYAEAQKELRDLRANKQYFENTKIMLQDD